MSNGYLFLMIWLLVIVLGIGAVALIRWLDSRPQSPLRDQPRSTEDSEGGCGFD